jgi:hypothetical protein
LISLFGWFLTLRGLALLVVPHLYEKAGIEAMNAIFLADRFRPACPRRSLADLYRLDREAAAASLNVTCNRART